MTDLMWLDVAIREIRKDPEQFDDRSIYYDQKFSRGFKTACDEILDLISDRTQPPNNLWRKMYIETLSEVRKLRDEADVLKGNGGMSDAELDEMLCRMDADEELGEMLCKMEAEMGGG